MTWTHLPRADDIGTTNEELLSSFFSVLFSFEDDSSVGWFLGFAVVVPEYHLAFR